MLWFLEKIIVLVLGLLVGWWVMIIILCMAIAAIDASSFFLLR